MLAYAANRPTPASRRSSPHGFLIIASAHVVAIAALMSAKMDLPRKIMDPPTVVQTYRVPRDRPPEAKVDPASRPNDARLLPAPSPIPLPRPDPNVVRDPGSTDIGPFVAPDPLPLPRPMPSGETRGATLLTPTDELKPPYPRDKLALEQEASLTLRLSIDEDGRVVAVEPVGRADRSFLDAARRHLIAHWRYRPAMDHGRAIATTIVTTLHFRLDG